MIIKSIMVGMYGTNCYIVASETSGKGLIIDPGAEAEVIIRTIHKMGVEVVYIVATHFHNDHIGALRQVKDATKAKFAIHKDMAISLTPQSFQAEEEVKKVTNEGAIIEPDIWLKDADIIGAGEIEFSVIFTPGHTAGGICLYGQGVLFSGDTLFNYGVGRTDFRGGDWNTLLKSLQILLKLPEETRVYPGHGPSTTISQEKRGNPFIR